MTKFASQVRTSGCCIVPTGTKARPRQRRAGPCGPALARRTYQRKTALVRVCPGGRAGLAGAPPTWGCVEPGAAKCPVCFKGFKKAGACFRRHVASCSDTTHDPLPLSSRQKIPFWVRRNTTDESAFYEVFRKSAYESRRRGFRLEEARTWLDLGGHIGTFTCLALARGCDVIAFEPNDENADLLAHNARSLPIAKSCALQLHRAAVASSAHRERHADVDGTVELLGRTDERDTWRNTVVREREGVVLCSNDSGRCGKCGKPFKSSRMREKHESRCRRRGTMRCVKCQRLFLEVRLRQHMLTCTGEQKLQQDYRPVGRVPVFTLKEVLQEYPQIEGVKIDIEGAEIEMLEEMQPADWGSVKRLTFEYSNEYDRSAPRLRKLIANLAKHFKGGVFPDKPGTYEVGDKITFPVYLSMLVHASTDHLAPVQRRATAEAAGDHAESGGHAVQEVQCHAPAAGKCRR